MARARDSFVFFEDVEWREFRDSSRERIAVVQVTEC